MKKTKTKCYLYTRVSTSMQVDGYSLDAQRDKLRKYAEYEDMVVAGEYSDEGFSGKNIQGRHEFQRMLQDIQDCKDLYTLPPWQISTSSQLERAFTTDAPTPCRPPDTLYPPPPNLPPACRIVNTTSTAGIPAL